MGSWRGGGYHYRHVTEKGPDPDNNNNNNGYIYDKFLLDIDMTNASHIFRYSVTISFLFI